MALAEYEGQKAIADVIPDHAVMPLAWGYFNDDKTKSWFLTRFRHLRDRTPQLENFLPVVRRLHEDSVSPTGMFGFHVTPFYGPPPMIVDWTSNWEHFWTREFRSGLTYAQKMRGDNPELVQVADEFIAKVVPRLLRPLQTGGRNIKPSLCHGDLWDGNIQTDAKTQLPVVFDPCAFYGHHEMDLQCMRGERYTIGLGFVRLYGEVGASEPTEDFDDRNALYAMSVSYYRSPCRGMSV
jgi:fructosamine-3-kinase